MPSARPHRECLCYTWLNRLNVCEMGLVMPARKRLSNRCGALLEILSRIETRVPRQRTVARCMIDFQTNPVRIFKKHVIIAWRPMPFTGADNDMRLHISEQRVHFVYILTRTRPQANVVQTDARLDKPLTGVLRGAGLNTLAVLAPTK